MSVDFPGWPQVLFVVSAAVAISLVLVGYYLAVYVLHIPGYHTSVDSIPAVYFAVQPHIF